jgi:branched-chain amino acid transport system permease protein
MAVSTVPVSGRSLRNPLAGAHRGERTIMAFLLIAALVYPFISNAVTSFQILGISLPAPTVNNLIVMCYYGVLALGLNIVVGFAGLLDLGYVAFYVFGAYTTAFLASPQFGLHLPWLVVAPIAVVIAAGAGVLLGAPTLRLRGDYLAIVTLGFGEIVPQLMRNLDKVNVVLPGGTVLVGPNANITGGALGINPVDALNIPLPGLLQDLWHIKNLQFSNANPHASFYLVVGILLLSFFVCRRLRDSRLGRAWMAIREDETAAGSMGINTVTTKLLAFSLGASFSGFVGAFVASYQTAVFPESFNFSVSISILIMVILGGMGSLRGVVVGAFALTYVSQTFLPFLGKFVDPPIDSIGKATGIGLLANFTLVSLNYLIFGVVLVLMMIFRPEGLLPVAARKAELHGEGIAAEGTFGTTDSVAQAATEFESAEGELGVADETPAEVAERVADRSADLGATPGPTDGPPGDRPGGAA